VTRGAGRIHCIRGSSRNDIGAGDSIWVDDTRSDYERK
jgi:hypothetical protein